MIGDMSRASFANWPCSIARTMDLLGDGWTPLVLREVFYGVTRFDAIRDSLGIARTPLADRLRRLVDEGLLERQAYQAGPARYDYVLTDKGRDVFPVLVAMARWGERWLATEPGPSIVFHHDACGQQSQGEVVCAGCGEPMTALGTRMRTGPGVQARSGSR